MSETEKEKKQEEREEALRNADDTGLLAQQEEINEDEVLLGEEGRALEDDGKP